MAIAMPTKIGTKGKASSKTPIVEEATPRIAMKTGMMTVRDFPLNMRSRPETRPLKAPVAIISPIEA